MSTSSLDSEAHGLFDGVGNVVELQIQKDLVSPRLDLPHDLRALGIEQLHADLHIGLARLVFKLVQKGVQSPRALGKSNAMITSPRLISTHLL